MNCPACGASNIPSASRCACGEVFVFWRYLIGGLGGFLLPYILVVEAKRLGLTSEIWWELLKGVAQLSLGAALGCWVKLLDPRPREGCGANSGTSIHCTDFSGTGSDCSSDSASDSCGGDFGGGDCGGGD